MSSILHTDYLEITPCVKWSLTTKVKNNGHCKGSYPQGHLVTKRSRPLMIGTELKLVSGKCFCVWLDMQLCRGGGFLQVLVSDMEVQLITSLSMRGFHLVITGIILRIPQNGGGY